MTKNKIIILRLDENELDKVRGMANKLNLTVSDYVRFSCGLDIVRGIK